jgi:hypothetical protein
VLKHRKPGISSYVAARYFRRAQVVRGTGVYIMSHEATSSKTLFRISDLFYRKLPAEYRPYRGRSSKTSMEFTLMESFYETATAGAVATGRSQTPQLFHGSEVAHWKNAEDHMSSSVQAVPSEPGTEIILETTAKGIGGTFYDMWIKAERGEGDYIAIFFAWFEDADCARPAPEGWTPTGDEAEMQDLYGRRTIRSIGITTRTSKWAASPAPSAGGCGRNTRAIRKRHSRPAGSSPSFNPRSSCGPGASKPRSRPTSCRWSWASTWRAAAATSRASYRAVAGSWAVR